MLMPGLVPWQVGRVQVCLTGALLTVADSGSWVFSVLACGSLHYQNVPHVLNSDRLRSSIICNLSHTSVMTYCDRHLAFSLAVKTSATVFKAQC